jgi:hypothetical protein
VLRDEVVRREGAAMDQAVFDAVVVAAKQYLSVP